MDNLHQADRDVHFNWRISREIRIEEKIFQTTNMIQVGMRDENSFRVFVILRPVGMEGCEAKINNKPTFTLLKHRAAITQVL